MEKINKTIHNNKSGTNQKKENDIKVRKTILYDKLNTVRNQKPKIQILSDIYKINKKNEHGLNINKKFSKEINKMLSKNNMERSININPKNPINIKAQIIYKNIKTTNISYQNNTIITEKRPIHSKKKAIIRTLTKSLSISDISVNNENTDEIEKESSRLKSLRTYLEDSDLSDNKVENSKENEKYKIIPDDFYNSVNIAKKNRKIIIVPNHDSLSKSYTIKNSNKMKNKIKVNSDNKYKTNNKIKDAAQVKKNLFERSFKYYLKLNNKKGAKENKNKINPKILIINDNEKKDKSYDKYNNKDINKTEKANKNKISKTQKIIFELKKKLSNDLNMSNSSINKKFKLMKYIKKKISKEKIEKCLNDISNIKHYTKLNQYLKNSNSLINNTKNSFNNGNEKNLVYAPKKIKIRLNGQEKKIN